MGGEDADRLIQALVERPPQDVVDRPAGQRRGVQPSGEQVAFSPKNPPSLES
jgi:hypothetical protein